MKVLIVEDEKLAAINLEKHIQSLDSNLVVVEKLGSVRESVKWLSENAVDLIFLDIQLSDGLSFEIFNQIKVSTPIIFTTAYDQYAIKAFKLNSIDYLLKPIDKIELASSLQKFNERTLERKIPDIDYVALINSLKNTPEYQKRFVVFAGQKIKSIPTKDIAYFYTTEKSVFLITNENIQYSIDFTLDKLEEIIDPKQFFRLNRKLIANIDSIKNIYAATKSRITIQLNPSFSEEVVVSISRSVDFREWLNQ
ncbi:MAG: LytTR family DNA-binding domain-containing protein [Bacteroidota bacterium]